MFFSEKFISDLINKMNFRVFISVRNLASTYYSSWVFLIISTPSLFIINTWKIYMASQRKVDLPFYWKVSVFRKMPKIGQIWFKGGKNIILIFNFKPLGLTAIASSILNGKWGYLIHHIFLFSIQLIYFVNALINLQQI